MNVKIFIAVVTILLLWGNLAISQAENQDFLRAVNILITGVSVYLIVSLKEKGCSVYQEPDYDPADDPLLPQAREEVLRAGKASASLLQRRLSVGYASAARLLDSLEEEGFIGEVDGAKPRKVLFDDHSIQ